MKRSLGLRSSIVVVIFLAATVGQAAVDDLTEVVPTGASVVYYVADVPGTLAQWEGSPMAKLWGDPQVSAFFAPLLEDMEVGRWDEMVTEETGYGLEELKAMFTGDLIVYLESLDFALDEGNEDVDFAAAMLVTVGENASKLEELVLKQEEKASETTEDDPEEDGTETVKEIREFREIDLHIERTYENDELTDEFGWATVEGVFAVASPVESLERVVADILDGGTDDPLRSGTNFATISKHAKSADIWLFVDVDPWVPLVRTALDLGVAAANEGGSPFPMDPATIMESSGIEAMQAFFATFNFDGRITAMDFGLTYTENRGLIKLMAYGPEKAPRPTYIPIDSDTFTTAHFDFGDTWSALVEIVNGINPSLMGMAEMQFQSMLQGAGAELDLKRDLLENLTGEVASIQNLDGIIGDSIVNLQLKQDQVVLLGINQREALENAIETLKGVVGQGSEFFSEREFEDHTIFTLDLPQAEGEPPGDDIAYTITDGYLLISVGSPATLEKGLLKLGTKGDSVWKLPQVKHAVGMLPEGANAVQYQDLKAIGDLVFNALVVAQNIQAGEDQESRFCDPTAMPDPGVVGKYLSSGVTGVWKDDRSLVIRALILPTDE